MLLLLLVLIKLHLLLLQLVRQTPSLPDARPRSDRFRCGGRESNFLAAGNPYYIKIDIEHYDAQILRALFSAGVFPPFISAELHSIEVFALLVAQGGYNAFKLVDGGSVSRVYSNRLITCENEQKQVKLSFPFHAAGPFGNDVDGVWMTADNFLRVLALEGLGWKDIHATNLESAGLSTRISSYDLILGYIRRDIKARLLGMRASLRKRLTLS